MPIVESAVGVLAARDIAAASERVVALTIGLEDYTADLGVAKTAAGEETAWARAMIVTAARAAGVTPIDSVFGDVDDMEGLEAWGRRSRAMGFSGMGCIHPRQIPVIHRAFAPDPGDIEKARAIVAAYEDAIRAGHGVVALGSKMIDAPVVKRAEETMRMARELGLINA
jgi:citrate lyase subunit beta/citryl-CoA lyase